MEALMNSQEAIKIAVAACGRQVNLARAVGVTPGFANQWVHGLRPIPAHQCIPIEEACGGVVTRYDLRPDVFGSQAA